jgi:hypothetical protein
MTGPTTFVAAYEEARAKAVEAISTEEAPERSRVIVHVAGPTEAVVELAGRLQRSLARWPGGSVVLHHRLLWKATYRRETFELELEVGQ